jgi:ABC-type amino acid transport substrate-binding protein
VLPPPLFAVVSADACPAPPPLCAAFTDPVRICITPYAPFTLHSSWADTNGGALEDDTLAALTPLDTTISGDDTTLAGFDMDISKLVFGRMLGLNMTYTAKATHAEMYLSLRSGDCDVAITAIEMCVCSQ